MNLIWIDWVILGILLVSTIMSVARGAVRESIALASWIVGVYLAFIWTPQYQDLLKAYVETPEFRYGLTFMGILILVLIAGGIAAFFLSKLIGIIGLSGLDKIFGIAFGVVRGLFLVVLAVAAARFTSWPQQDWWQDSVALPKIEQLSDRLIDWVLASSWLPPEEKKVLTDRLEAQEKAQKTKQKNKDWFSGGTAKPSAPSEPAKNKDVSAAPADTSNTAP